MIAMVLDPWWVPLIPVFLIDVLLIIAVRAAQKVQDRHGEELRQLDAAVKALKVEAAPAEKSDQPLFRTPKRNHVMDRRS